MTVDFSDHFWGEGPKNSGVDVLFQNLKYGVTTSRDVGDFLRERSTLEESHSRALGKLAKTASNGCSQGSFSPLWQFLKTSSEKLASAHVQMAQKVDELMKELSKYADELQKKHKSVKEDEASTIEAVQMYQNSKSMVSKTKAIYMQRFVEFEKCQKDNMSQKETEKADVKMRKAHEEYKSWVEKYQICTEDYLVKFSKACQRFQNLEAIYLKQMKDFLNSYATLMENNHEVIGQIHVEFREMCSQLSVEELLLKFVTHKATGKDRPSALDIAEDVLPTADAISQRSGSSEDKSSIDRAPIPSEKKREGNSDKFVSSDDFFQFKRGSRRTTSLLSQLNLFIPQSQQGYKGTNSNPSRGIDFPNLELSSVSGQVKSNSKPSSTTARSPPRGSKWFLRGRNKGKKKDKKNEQSEKDDKSDGDDKEVNHKPAAAEEVDDEGYSVRPQQLGWETEKNNFYSSSDTDSDEEPERRLHVEIKPLTNGTAPLSASVDELRTTIENITLSPMGLNGRRMNIEVENKMKRSQSVSQQIGGPSSPSTHPYTPLSPPIVPTSTNQNNNTTSRYADLGDLFAEVGEIQPSSVFTNATTRTRSTPTPSGTAIPRPSSRPQMSQMLNQRNINTPSPSIVSRADSVSSIDSRNIGHFTGSRGPSPLTLGMHDATPLAVAFHEIIHAYFKGNDETKCQIKMTGDMMVSFPAGIIQVFANNPSPAQLKFKVRSKQLLKNLESKPDLVQVESDGNELTFEFKMSALISILKSQAEKNPSASYFNVDIFKYQIQPKPGAASCPLHLVAFWKCEEKQTDLRIDYKYNSHATEIISSETLPNLKGDSAGATLLQVCIAAPVDGGVKSLQSKPTGQWYPTSNRACWKIPSLSSTSENLGVGSLRARFEITSGPSSRGTIAAQFSCESCTLSGSDFELMTPAYRVSLVKKRFVSGKYICDAEDTSHRYSTLPPDSPSFQA
ncbi:F-BAR domain only protein 2 [Folsomia candida]|uniref:F-BAR domain only protein 2 n=1 Tax=Folsomia candida TaxID=158441 RepID=A0A226E6M7_FOLCA|nr:F-BAR domain only protein 2 [Folsomia candida]